MDEGASELQTTLERDEPGLLRLRFAGKSASREAGRVLAPTFDAALSQATSERRGLELRFERLEYFNSSTISALVQFIRSAQRAGVPVTVVYDAKQRWQAMSFEALQRAMRPFQTGSGPSITFTEL